MPRTSTPPLPPLDFIILNVPSIPYTYMQKKLSAISFRSKQSFLTPLYSTTAITSNEKASIDGSVNKLTPWRWVLLEKPPVAQLLIKFRIFYGTRNFISVLTRKLHWFLNSSRSTQSIFPQPSSPESKVFSVIIELTIRVLCFFIFDELLQICNLIHPSHSLQGPR
jgi:hypothetical protein